MKLAPFAVAALLASPAFADKSPPASAACGKDAVNLVECRVDQPTRDWKSVQIRRCGKQIVAVLKMQGMADKPEEVASWKVTHKVPKPGLAGGGESYTARNFSLAVNWTTSPRAAGHVGRVKAKHGGERIDEELICRRTR
jgi:hypothetical protein